LPSIPAHAKSTLGLGVETRNNMNPGGPVADMWFKWFKVIGIE